MGSTVQRGLLLVVLATVMIIALWVLLPEQSDDDGPWTVVAVASGHTIEVNRGEETALVLLAGVTAPGVGECGFEESREYLEGSVGGVQVTLIDAGLPDWPDEGGSWQRYVEVQGLDVGLAQIAQSHAVADGTDHPRAAEYKEVDAATPDPCE